MKLSKRETVLLIILAVMICAVAYYLLWFAPSSARISELRLRNGQMAQEIEDVAIREIQYDILAKTKESNAESWEELIGSVHDGFDEADVLNRARKIIEPYTTDIIIEFTDPSVKMDRTEIYQANIGFTVTYSELKNILAAFEREDVEIRIVNCSCVLKELIGTEPVLEVSMSVEFLTLIESINNANGEGEDGL